MKNMRIHVDVHITIIFICYSHRQYVSYTNIYERVGIGDKELVLHTAKPPIALMLVPAKFKNHANFISSINSEKPELSFTI